jgi:membrane protein YdbS with pleckstrin-like domain
MPSVICDRCDKPFEIRDARPGTKVACPACGDVKIVPELSGQPAVVAVAVEGSSPASRAKTDALGIPPDSGPEQRALYLRPAMFRARPLTVLLLWLAFFGGIIGGIILFAANPVVGGVIIGAGIVAGLVLAGWYVFTFENRLEITNKRIIATRGIFSRATSEVPHEKIQNIQVNQTFVQRLMKIGTVGISSAGQSDIEIVFSNAPNPYRIREVIDAYRNAMN